MQKNVFCVFFNAKGLWIFGGGEKTEREKNAHLFSWMDYKYSMKDNLFE